MTCKYEIEPDIIVKHVLLVGYHFNIHTI